MTLSRLESQYSMYADLARSGFAAFAAFAVALVRVRVRVRARVRVRVRVRVKGSIAVMLLFPGPAHATAPALVAGQQAERSDPAHGERGLHRAEAGDHDQRRAQPHGLGRHDAVARVQLREDLVRY